jgi:hypothetical protein
LRKGYGSFRFLATASHFRRCRLSLTSATPRFQRIANGYHFHLSSPADPKSMSPTFPASHTDTRYLRLAGPSPRWSGTELFFIDPHNGNLTAVSVETTAQPLKLGVPHVFFATHGIAYRLGVYDARPDGQRFLVNSADQQCSTLSSVQLGRELTKKELAVVGLRRVAQPPVFSRPVLEQRVPPSLRSLQAHTSLPVRLHKWGWRRRNGAGVVIVCYLSDEVGPVRVNAGFTKISLRTSGA